jgi:hypothetical protein
MRYHWSDSIIMPSLPELSGHLISRNRFGRAKMDWGPSHEEIPVEWALWYYIKGDTALSNIVCSGSWSIDDIRRSRPLYPVEPQRPSKLLMKRRLEQRAIIDFLSIEGRKADEIRTLSLLLSGEATHAHVTISGWIRERSSKKPPTSKCRLHRSSHRVSEF